MKTIKYEDFKRDYYKSFKNSSYRLGQHIINTFIKKEDKQSNYDLLWQSEDVTIIEDLFFRIVENNQWDLNNLTIVRDI